MKPRKGVFGIFFILLIFLGFIQPVIILAVEPEYSETEKILRKVADGVIKEATFQFIDQNDISYDSALMVPANARLRLANGYNDWRYWNGVLNIAMLRLGDDLEEPTYTQFVNKNIAFCFDNYRYFKDRYANESKWDYPFGQFFIMEELDDCGAMGTSVILVNCRDPQRRYRQYFDEVANHILFRQARLEDGTLVRAFPRKWSLWADDLYMSIVFLSRMDIIEDWSLAKKGQEEAVRQVINFHKYLFDEQTGLMKHNWYSDTGQPGVAFWGRANGWAIVAQIDLLERLPDDHPQKDTLLTLFHHHIEGVTRYQSETGLWHQLLDRNDSFPETSCTAMFTYAIARAVNLGYLEQKYIPVAIQGWRGVMTKIRPDGLIEGICTGTGISDSVKDYYTRPTPLNDPHGIGTILLAGSEIRKLLEWTD